MKLIVFQIKNYKVIDDTMPVKADPRVTALVGKNESGGRRARLMTKCIGAMKNGALSS